MPMQQTRATSTHPRHGERGAALIVALVAVTALLGIGMVTMLTVRSDTAASGADRFQQVALYAAESGAAAGMEFVRDKSDATTKFSAYVEPNNVSPQSPTGVLGNAVQPGETHNPFTDSPNTWYQVTILNNPEDSGFAAGNDTDGTIILRSTGHGPNQTQVTIEMIVRLGTGAADPGSVCRTDYAQGFDNSSNSNTAGCSAAISTATLRSANP